MIILISLFFLNFAQAQPVPFKINEKLTYKAFFSGVPAGKGELTVIKLDTIQGIPAYHVCFKAWTTGFTDKLFSINDKIDVWLDVKSMNTLKVEKRIQEGDYKKKSTSLFYHDNGYATVDGDTISIPKGSQSPYSLFYSLRKESIPNLNGIILSTLSGKKLTELEFLVSPQKNMSVPFGIYNCNEIMPARTDRKQFKNKGKISIWFSDQKPEQIPVKIWLKLKYGSLVLELMGRAN